VLPTDSKARKRIPLYSGLFKYFPDALAEVAKVSQIGNDQHNPGEPLHWSRGKSDDHEDAALRHLIDRASGETMDGESRQLAKAAWRILAALQIELEAVSSKPGE
jgi:hypothetical protein